MRTSPGNVRPVIPFPFSREINNREYEREKQTKSYNIPTYTVASGFPSMFSDPVFFFPSGLPSLQSNDRIAAATSSSSSRPTTDHRASHKETLKNHRTHAHKETLERKKERHGEILHVLVKIKTRGGVSHGGLVIYIKKIKYLKAKRRIMETQIFHHAKI
jgi:hypothetical protein